MYPKQRPLKIAIVGAGIGGLSAAISLTLAGHDVHIYEQSARLTEVGAGLQVTPNSARVLQHLGLGPTLARDGVQPERSESRRWLDGKLLGTHVMNENPPKYGAPHYVLRRADLLAGLLQKVPSRQLSLNSKVVRVDQDSKQGILTLANGAEIRADLILGADGIHSTIGHQIFSPGAPSYSGTVAFRALLPAEEVAKLNLQNTSTKWWGETGDHHLVHYYVSAFDTLNIIAVIPNNTWREESWTSQGEDGELYEAFKAYADPIPEMTKKVRSPMKFALYDRPALKQWTTGKIGLLGDACHPMVPFLGQGAAMAVEDAVVLTRSLNLTKEVGVEGALKVYEATRKSRTNAVQLGSRTDTSDSWNVRDWVYSYDAITTPLLTEALT